MGFGDAVASATTHTSSLHSMFTGRMLFLTPNQQCQSTEGIRLMTHTHTHTHPFNGSLSGTIRVSRYQKGKTNLDFTGARDSEWQWHQVCTSLQTDNHTSTSPLSFLQAGCPSCRPTNSVKALKAQTNDTHSDLMNTQLNWWYSPSRDIFRTGYRNTKWKILK